MAGASFCPDPSRQPSRDVEIPEAAAPQFRVQITANFTAEPLAAVLAYWTERLGWADSSWEFSPYGQVFQQLLDPASASAASGPGANVFLVRVEDWGRDAAPESRAPVIEENTVAFAQALTALAQRTSRPTLVFVARPSTDDPTLTRRTRELVEHVRALRGVQVLTHDELVAGRGDVAVEDPEADRAWHIPFTDDYGLLLGTGIVRKLRPWREPPRKVIVVDADNTLWDRVVAEVGAGEIELGEGRLALQRHLRECQQAGMLLALASKNREEDVRAAFARPEMILRREDFVAWKVGWMPKSASVRDLATELSLGLDSFVFVDDNPVECAEVQAACPEVTVLELPADAAEAAARLRQCWALDQGALTQADTQRTAQYRQQAERQQWKSRTTSFREFIDGLELRVECVAPGPETWERAAQLTQRTNQFNNTGVRRTAAELTAWLATPGRGSFVVRAEDRFGDYGWVGFATYERRGDDLWVETLLLSCRALGKGVEHRMLAHLGNVASHGGATRIVVAFHPTDRNEPAARFLRSVAGTAGVTEPFALSAEAASRIRFEPAEAENGDNATTAERSAEPTGTTPSRTLRARVDFASIARDTRSVRELRRAVRRASMKPRPVEAARYVAPRPGIEERLAGVWEEVLRVAPIGRDDGFLEVGGRSIQAAQVLARLANGWGVRLTLTEFFAHSRLAAMAEAIRGQPRSAEAAGEASVTHLPRATANLLAPAQERMWFLDQFIPRRAAYNIVLGWRLRGPLDRAAWQAALHAVVRRHEPLRTTIQAEGAGGRVVRVADEMPPTAVFESAADEAEARRRLAHDAATPFDLAHGPLLRTRVVTVGVDDHWCLFNVHHVAADGWSMGLLFHEWSTVYAAQRAGKPHLLPSLAARYADYAFWLTTPAVTRRFAADLTYWQQKLAGAPRLLELPTDSPRPAVMTYEGAVVTEELSAATVAAVERLAASVGTTPFAVLLAAFQAQLHRYTGQTDLLIGTPVSGRIHPAVEELIGCFVNTLVIRNTVQGETTFDAQVRAVSQTVWEALEHDELPFERLVDSLKLGRDLSHSPLFQVMLVFQNTPPGAPRLDGCHVEPVVVHNSGAKFDLVLEVTPRGAGQGYGLMLEYNAGMFEAATARRWLGHFARLLDAACAAPATPLARLPLLGEAERLEIARSFGTVCAAFPEAGTLGAWFARQARLTPQATAVTCEGASLTYAELEARANRLARHLVKAGVKPDTLVGLCVERSLAMVVAVVGVLKAGGAYLPIDLSYPADRLAFMLEDAQAPVLLSQRSLLGSLPPTAARVVLVDDDEAYWQSESAEAPEVAVTPDHLAYVIYTSGSTGKPKGCMITHRNVTRLMRATESWFGFGPADVWTLFHSYAFDFSVWEIWGALLYGGRLVVVPYLVSRSPEAFYALLADEGVTVLNQTPSAFRQLIQAEEAAGPKPLALRYVIFGGEALEMQSLRPWFERHGDQTPRLVNMYGITETTVHVTYRPLSRDDVVKASVIGVPIPDLTFHILDAQQQPVPLGIPGEIYVGGGGVARGYLRRPELTAQRFVPNPFAADPSGERLYRTGDLARFLAGGDVEYLGRIDLQVKIRGFRIELGEIESVLCQHAAVRECVVLAREDRPGEKRLVAYLVRGADHPEPTTKELRDHLKCQVPDYMVPSAFVFLSQLPLTSNGKVDRRALPDPGVQRLTGVGLSAAPSSSLERSIAKICQESLRVENLGVEDNFFDLGAHSILLVGIHQRLRRELGREFPLVTMFHFPTIRGLAQHLGGPLADTASNPASASSATGGASGAIEDRARRQREANRKLRLQRSA